MLKRSIGAASLISCLALAGAAVTKAQTAPQQGQWATIQTYCVTCHNGTAKTGGLALDSLSPDRIAEDAQIWEAAIRKLRGGLMPPPGAAKRPDKQATTELIAWLENKIDAAAIQAVHRDAAGGRMSGRRIDLGFKPRDEFGGGLLIGTLCSTRRRHETASQFADRGFPDLRVFGNPIGRQIIES